MQRLLIASIACVLAVSPAALAQKLGTGGNSTTLTTGVKGIDIIVRKRPGGQNMTCMVGSKPCNQDQVRVLAAELNKSAIRISLAGTSGALTCSHNGWPCTDDSVAQVQAAGKAVASRVVSGI